MFEEFEEAASFGMEAKIALVKKGMTQRELVQQTAEMTGLYVDDAVISRVLAGSNKNEHLRSAIRKILDMPEDRAYV